MIKIGTQKELYKISHLPIHIQKSIYDDVKMLDENYGQVSLKLNEMIEKSGLSKNKVAFKAEIQRTQLNNYCKGKIQRIDLDVLARLCYVLDCTPGDLLQYKYTDEN